MEDCHDYLDGGPITVPINIKNGSMGRAGKKYEDIAILHNQTRAMEVDMIWSTAIWKEFKIKLDPNRYFVRRTDASSVMHSLTEPLSQLLAEFKIAPKDNWKVTIIDNELQKGNKVSITPGKRKTSLPAKKENKPKKKKLSYPKLMPELLPLPPAPSPPLEPRDNYNNTEDEYDDANSDGSQDSQKEDLDRLMIENEDLKSLFLDRIQKYLTGEMLMEAQEALQAQKERTPISGKRNRWAKWTLDCPYATSLLRSLFDV